MRGSYEIIQTGMQYGDLKIIKELEPTLDEQTKRKRPVLCLCKCGNEKRTYLSSLKAGKVRSCGCIKSPRIEIGKRYCSLVVLKELPRDKLKNYRRMLCCCDCGKEKIANLVSLARGAVRSCGCLQSESAAKAKTTHGLSGTHMAVMFKNMLSRCYNSKHPYYKYYGGRGIEVCSEWKIGGLSAFSRWAFTNGYATHLTIERDDFNGNYEPNNCSFATEKEQANNRSTNSWIHDRGTDLTFSEYHEKYGVVAYGTALHRWRTIGWSPWQSVCIPLRYEHGIIKVFDQTATLMSFCKQYGVSVNVIAERLLKGKKFLEAVAMKDTSDLDSAVEIQKPYRYKLVKASKRERPLVKSFRDRDRPVPKSLRVQ